MVCYTNHALDQFLNLISKATLNFIRLGAGSKDETLKDFTLKEYLKQQSIKYTRGFSNAIRELDDL